VYDALSEGIEISVAVTAALSERIQFFESDRSYEYESSFVKAAVFENCHLYPRPARALA
jgi:hypothetical protein